MRAAAQDVDRMPPLPQYVLRCTGCGSTFADDGIRLECPEPHPPALLRSVYAEQRFDPHGTDSILRYGAWLPRRRVLSTKARIGVYRSEVLGRHFGLDQLWVAFDGWWPAHDAALPTGTFKDLEAYAVLARFPAEEERTLVVASAGNTAAAFAEACTAANLPIVIVIPLDAWPALRAVARIGPTVRVVALSNAQYDDAIAFARRLAETNAFVFEGGARNVARRDGMGLAMLAAVEAIGALPSAYVQAVGSGAGALAAHEAAQRLAADGRFGTGMPRLVLAQNAPFTPIHDAWQQQSKQIAERSDVVARGQLSAIAATVLSNRTPPYAPAGGVYDALVESGGATYAIENTEIAQALALFERLEGIDLDPAAAVATAALGHAVREGTVAREDVVLLHVTGGGRRALTAKNPTSLRPALILERDSPADVALVLGRRSVDSISA
jgi:cysteate synthase